jgi:hypothetical protein
VSATLSVLEILLGVFVVTSAIVDVFRVVVMPRPFYGRSVSKALVRTAWRLWRRIGVRVLNPKRRESWLGASAQVALLLLLAYWVVGLVLGYALILHALRHELAPQPVDFGTALYLSAVSLLTLGIGDVVPTGVASRTIVVFTAASGPALIGVVLALLFSLYASFQRREALITTLDASAGAPPSGVRMLETTDFRADVMSTAQSGPDHFAGTVVQRRPRLALRNRTRPATPPTTAMSQPAR